MRNLVAHFHPEEGNLPGIPYGYDVNEDFLTFCYLPQKRYMRIEKEIG